MIPTHWVVLTELPYGPTGKVDRARLLNQLSEDRSPLEKSGGNVSVSAGGNATPLSVTRRVERIWKDVLGTESTRPSDNFLDLGGNSILAIQLASRLSADLTVDLDPTDVLLAESLAELRDRVEARLAGSPDGHGALA
jgi:acyl carrier protein